MSVVRNAARLVGGVAAVSFALSACSSGGGDSGGSGGTYTFGLVTSSSGPFASNYKTMVAGAKYAQKVINDGGGVDGKKIKFVTVDIQNDPKNAVTQVPKLVAQQNVLAIVGPVDSAGCDIVCTTANKLKTPVVSPGAGRPGVLDKARPYGFTLAQPDADNSVPVLERAVKQKGFKTAAIITDDANETTKAQATLYEKVFADTGVRIAKRVTFATGDSSFTSQVTSMKAAKPDVIALAAGPDDAGRVAQEIRSQGLKATLMGTGSLQSGGAAYYAAGKDATEGTISAAQYDATDPTEPAKGLLAKAEKATGQSEIPLNFAYAFDAVNMIVKVIKDKKIQPGGNAAKSRVAIQEGLNDLGPFEGMAAKTSFKDDGTAIRPQLQAILQGGKFVIQRTTS